MKKNKIIRGLLQTGLIKLDEGLSHKGSWQYLNQEIVPSVNGQAIVFGSKKQEVRVNLEIELIFFPEKLPFDFTRNKSFNALINTDTQAQIDAMFEGLEMIFNVLIEDAYLLLGKIVSKNTADLPIAIIYIEKANIALYSILDEKSAKAIKASGKYLLN